MSSWSWCSTRLQTLLWMEIIVSRSGGREGVNNTVGSGQGSKEGRIPRVREGLVIEYKIY